MPFALPGRRAPRAARSRARLRATVAAVVATLLGTLAACDAATPPEARTLAVSLNPRLVVCAVGQTVALGVSVPDADGSPALTFASNTAVATGRADPNGVLVTCTAPGTTLLVVTATRGTSRGADTVEIVVDAPEPLAVSVEPALITCRATESAVVTARVADPDSARVTLTFTTSDARATVTREGSAARVQCVNPGTAVITASATLGRRGGSASTSVRIAQRPQSVVLMATPAMIADFANPDADVARFFDRYAPLTTRAAETVVVFAVGNSEHILTYQGPAHSADSVMWARYVDGKRVSDRVLNYDRIAGIVGAFRRGAATRGLRLKVFDQVDPGNEFTLEFFKFNRHPECMDTKYISFDVRARLKAESAVYASAPNGIAEGKLCGEFLVDQVNAYMRDLGFDGILYGNQFGTRGRWTPDNGPGYTAQEANGIRDFLAYSRRVYGPRQVIWFDSYNNTKVERDTFSFPADGYGFFDYILASGFCVITDTGRYVDNLRSKLAIPNHPPILATLDYVDPWYTYNSMTDYADESARLETVAVEYRDQIDGVFLFANDDDGSLVPGRLIESFAARFYRP